MSPIARLKNETLRYPFIFNFSRLPVTNCCSANSGQRIWHPPFKMSVYVCVHARPCVSMHKCNEISYLLCPLSWPNMSIIPKHPSHKLVSETIICYIIIIGFFPSYTVSGSQYLCTAHNYTMVCGKHQNMTWIPCTVHRTRKWIHGKYRFGIVYMHWP